MSRDMAHRVSDRHQLALDALRPGEDIRDSRWSCAACIRMPWHSDGVHANVACSMKHAHGWLGIVLAARRHLP